MKNFKLSKNNREKYHKNPPARKVSWFSHYGNNMEVPKKLKIELPYDPVIPFLDIYLDKTLIWEDTRVPMFKAALFTIAKTWKQPKCPSTDEQIEKM